MMLLVILSSRIWHTRCELVTGVQTWALPIYEARYEFPIKRPVRVESIERAGDRLAVVTDKGRFAAQAVVSATGTWSHPYIPEIEGRDLFNGVQVHSAHYIRPEIGRASCRARVCQYV